MMKSGMLNILLASLCLLLLLASCTPGGDTSQQATVNALENSVSQTATAAAAPTLQDNSANEAASRATQVVEQQVATQTVQTEKDSAAQEATRTAERPILAELPTYGVDPNKGRVAWIQNGLILETQGYNSFKADNQVPGTVVNDFALSAQITWNTQYGDSGCGFVFRSDGDQLKPSQYMLIMTRFASGHIGFTVMSKGQIVNVSEVFPKTNDNRFSVENDSTNEITIVGRGTKFQVYTNRSLVGEFDPDKEPVLPKLPAQPALPADKNNPSQQATYQAAEAQQQQEVNKIQSAYNEQLKLFRESNKDFPTGFVTMIAATQSGKVTCTYNNAWLWLIEDK
jgi:hypothetical protein